FKQDEHYRQNQLIAYLEEVPFDLIVTLCDESGARLFYPKDRLPNLRFLNYLTGYIKDAHKRLPYRDIHNRAIDVGYRGSVQPLTAGRLCYEKRQIGWAFEKHAKRRGLSTDISSRRKDRFMGDAWYAFLGGCKATLGTESGASIVDIDGGVEREYEAFKKQCPRATDEEVLKHLERYEGGPQYRAIAPRHFEAAACFTVQVMYEGYFQGIFQPNRHYIPLRRDYGNVDEVIDRVLDEKERQRITTCAYEEIICNPAYGYEAFVRRFDKKIYELLKEKM
ncbi:MAG: glycosyltransferase, partial [Clostridiales bacterium]|nr:glycosyltransferase [Clostridiales bacterium]